MLQRSISYGVCLLRTCGYCCVLAGGRHQRSDVPGPRCVAQARGTAWRNQASAQYGGATRRCIKLVLHRRNIPLSYQSDW